MLNINFAIVKVNSNSIYPFNPATFVRLSQGEHEFPTSNVMIFLCSVSSVKMRGDIGGIDDSRFKLSFHKLFHFDGIAVYYYYYYYNYA
jgi:hypothetical protein